MIDHLGQHPQRRQAGRVQAPRAISQCANGFQHLFELGPALGWRGGELSARPMLPVGTGS
ncbi:hypothetical protein C5E45_24065 [Nocardia nova]|uniref:Uncharacterized protein n=1 Tax=Nocardia nova TaxID=37330 RepID=A0A2S6AK96_9NOCA|nr:hypothetical protein C5E41_20840 [Nocardia nova]PPJ35637.1 hypothetical protein C5E45_24065 [Nocardia nova]